jgi:hypothetical protein
MRRLTSYSSLNAIQALNLAGNNVDALALKEIARSLNKISSLTTLDLTGNSIGQIQHTVPPALNEEGVNELIKALKKKFNYRNKI